MADGHYEDAERLLPVTDRRAPPPGPRGGAGAGGPAAARAAAFVLGMADGHYEDAERLLPVTDRLDTRSPASLHEAFPPEEAGRLAGSRGIRRTPAAPGST